MHLDVSNSIKYNYEYNEQGDVTKYYEGDWENDARVRVACTYDDYNRPEESSDTVNGKTYQYECEDISYPEEILAGFTTPLGGITYTRDALTRLTQKQIAAKYKTFTETYAYLSNLSNSNYTTQLVSELQFNSGVGSAKTLTYSYDANGNIKTIKEGTTAIASIVSKTISIWDTLSMPKRTS